MSPSCRYIGSDVLVTPPPPPPPPWRSCSFFNRHQLAATSWSRYRNETSNRGGSRTSNTARLRELRVSDRSLRQKRQSPRGRQIRRHSLRICAVSLENYAAMSFRVQTLQGLPRIARERLHDLLPQFKLFQTAGLDSLHAPTRKRCQRDRFGPPVRPAAN